MEYKTLDVYKKIIDNRKDDSSSDEEEIINNEKNVSDTKNSNNLLDLDNDTKLNDWFEKMNSQILTKINNFIKNRLIEFLGIFLMLISIFLLASIISYSPSDPNFIYTPENIEIKNIGGFYGSVISDFLLQSLGLVSIFLIFNFFYEIFWL